MFDSFGVVTPSLSFQERGWGEVTTKSRKIQRSAFATLRVFVVGFTISSLS
jgi:hypothetical protein